MVALYHDNSMGFDFIDLKPAQNTIKDIIDIIKSYPKIFVLMLKSNIYLDVTINSFDKNPIIDALNTQESLDKYLSSLEEIEEKIESIKEEDCYKKWYLKPYRYMLNSTYDDDGMKYWVGQLNEGKSALDIAEQFFFSDQFRDENLSDEDFVKRLYFTFLNRDPNEDMEGVNYWKGLMENKGYSRLLVLYGIAFSDEFKQLAQDAGITPYNSQNKLKAFLERLYALVMTRPQDAYGKTYDEEGLKYWMGVLQSGEKTGGDVVKDFYNAPEFTSKNLSDPEFVKNAYYAIMGREPDAEGLNYWIGQLAKISRNDLLDQFIHSEEFQNYAKEYGIKPF